MGGVEFGFEEKGVVTFTGVDGDVHGGDFGLLEVLYELSLFFRVEAKICIDGEDEEAVACGLASSEEVGRGSGIGLFNSIVAAPHVNDAKVGIGVEALGGLFPLVKHVALEGVTDLEPGEQFFFGDEFLTRAALEGVEVDEGLVGNHAGECQADARGGTIIVVATVKKPIVFDGKDLFEEDEAI